LFPPELLDAPDAPAGPRVWRVAHTRPRQEKSLARQLLAQQVPYYLPILARRNRIRGRIVPSQVPLFPGYVFMRADREERLAALATSRVVRTLEVDDQAKLWRDLRQVRQLIASGLPVTPEDRLEPGDLVEVRGGPLAGLQGRILRGAAGERFVVQVDFIQRGASVDIDQASLAAVRK
jgi:transcriptional antiterminator RfaH